MCINLPASQQTGEHLEVTVGACVAICSERSSNMRALALHLAIQLHDSYWNKVFLHISLSSIVNAEQLKHDDGLS
jgi:hypothetical protein